MSGGRRERQSAPAGQRSQCRQTDGQRAVAAGMAGMAGRGEHGRAERPPPVGDEGDRQTAALLHRANRGAG